jgi:hypothetical protein
MAEKVASSVTSKIGEMSAVVDSYVGPVLKNNYFKGALFLFFGLYAGFLAPALPNSVLHFFDTVVGKLLFIFLIAFIATRQIDGSIGVALIVAVMFLLTLTVLNNVKMNESFRNLGMEHFELMNQMRDVVSEQFADTATDGSATTNASTNSVPASTNSIPASTNSMPASTNSKKASTGTSQPTISETTKATREECLKCVMKLSKEDQMELQNEFCKHAPITASTVPEASTEHFESHYANFDL